MSTASITELVADSKGRGPLARLAACQLAAYYRSLLGYPPIGGAK